MNQAESLENSEQEMLVNKFHQHLIGQYPDLGLRWSRIYGKRWSYFLGGKKGITYSPLRIELNQHYGVCIENPEILAEAELGRVINLLREAFREPGA